MRYAIVIFLILVAFTTYGIYFPKGPGADEVSFSVFKGDNLTDIGLRLEKDGVIMSDLFFNIYAVLSGKRDGLQAGTYLVGPSMSIAEIVNRFYSGEVAQMRITIIEGWRSDEIADYLSHEFGFNRDIFLELVRSFENNNLNILSDRPDGSSLEGYLFPDTYLIPYGANEEDVIDMMLSNLDRRLTVDLRAEIKKQGRTIFEIINMASMIEREVRTRDDKHLVSGLLWRRIEIGMPLQVDATIIYLTRKRTTRVSIEETQIDSPYNTYLNKGLPVGPISNPGMNSILAAIYPKSSDYLFYLSKPDGETVFSRNFEEHIKAKNRYLR